MTIVKAILLREKEHINNIPNNAGYYKWYAPESVLKVILPEHFEQIIPELHKREINDETYYYIYVGISKSLKQRLNTHVNKTSRTSTLRRTLSSLVAKNQNDQEKTNALINQMFVEYIETEMENAQKIEQYEISNNTLPLNLEFQQNNKLAEYKEWLKNQRKTVIQIKK